MPKAAAEPIAPPAPTPLAAPRNASRVKPKPDGMYFLQPDGVFRPVENISMTASAPVYPVTLHGLQRRMILADDKTHAVQRLPKEMHVTRNADLSAVLISQTAPTAAMWTALKKHMEREAATAEVVAEGKRQAALMRKKKH
jgi:hypothetical protein